MTILHLASKSGNLEAVKYIMSLRKIYSNAQVCPPIVEPHPIYRLDNKLRGLL